jgi:hypothetical protein
MTNTEALLTIDRIVDLIRTDRRPKDRDAHALEQVRALVQSMAEDLEYLEFVGGSAS